MDRLIYTRDDRRQRVAAPPGGAVEQPGQRLDQRLSRPSCPPPRRCRCAATARPPACLHARGHRRPPGPARPGAAPPLAGRDGHRQRLVRGAGAWTASEAYTRNGSLEVGADGTLHDHHRPAGAVRTAARRSRCPMAPKLAIGSDGTVTARVGGSRRADRPPEDGHAHGRRPAAARRRRPVPRRLRQPAGQRRARRA